MTASVLQYDRIVSVLTGALTADMHDRQVAAIQTILRMYPKQMAIGDLGGIAAVVSAAAQRIETNSELASPLVSLLGLCSVDFQPYTVADAARATDSASAVVSAASACLRVPFADVQLAALDCLKAFSPAGCHGSGPLGSTALERSDAIQTMVEMLAHTQNQQVRLAIIRVARMCVTAESVARQLLSGGVLDCALDMLCADLRQPVASECIALLSGALEVVPEAYDLLGSLHTLAAIKDALVWLLLNGHSLADKEMRNDLLALSYMLAQDTNIHARFRESNLCEAVLLIGTCRELQIEHPAARHFVTDYTQQELDAMQLAWGTATALSASTHCQAAVEESGLMRVLLMYADDEGRYSLLDGWAPPQRAMLRASAFTHLPALCARLPQAVGRHDGARVLLHAALSQDVPSAAAAVSCIAAVASVTRPILAAGGGVGVLLALVRDMQARPAPMRRDALIALAHLCDGDASLQALALSSGAIEALLPYLRPQQGMLEASEHFLLVVIDCVWRVLLTRAESAIAFAEADGIHYLLDLLSVRLPLLTAALLSGLSDALEVPEGIQRARQWLSPQGESCGRVLAALWVAEDGRFRVEYEPSGLVLADAAGALVGDNRSRDLSQSAAVQQAVLRAKDAMPPAVRDRLTADLATRDLRVKLFVLLEKFGFSSFKDLTPEERARLMVAEQFVALRDGVMWREIDRELTQEDVRPISPDRERIQRSIDAAVSVGERVQHLQRDHADRVSVAHVDGEKQLARSLRILADSNRSLRDTLAMRTALKPKTMPTRRTPVRDVESTLMAPSALAAAQASPVTESGLSDSGLRGYLEDEVVATMVNAAQEEVAL